MNRHQEHLLGLIKEIDQICRKHDIRYYSAGGTVIGAVRHGGFIPWDDDIDIYMTRDEFRRFVRAFEEDGREDRALEYHEGNHEFYSMIPRYLERDTTMFCRYHMVGHSVAGTLIDIFILDPAPTTFDEQREYLAKLFVYCDLVMPVYTYSHRTPEKYRHFYEEYTGLIDEIGYHGAIARLEEDLFSIEEKDSEYYSLRWGSVPHIFPKAMIGDPVWMPFEDMELPMPQQWYEYLVMLYGSGWMEIPYVDLRDEHTNILRYDMSYEYFFEKRDALFDQKALMDLYRRRKDLRCELISVGRPIEEHLKNLEAEICMVSVEKRKAALGKDTVFDLFERKEYGRIVEIYEPYISQQTARYYMGGQRHTDYYHWIYPILIPISEKELNCLLQSLLRAGRMNVVEKLTGIYRRANRKSEAVDRALECLAEINGAGLLYYTGEYAACRAHTEASAAAKETTKLQEYRWLSAVRLGLTEEEGTELQELAERDGAPEGIRKAWGDWLWDHGRREEAEALYRELMTVCRNGLFWNDIRGRGVDIPEIPTEKPSAFVDTTVTRKQKQLLDELVDICARHGIHYVIGSSLGRRMYVCGNVGYSMNNRVIYMDAKNGSRLLEALAKEKPKDRRIKSWLNDDNVNDFSIRYEDTGSVYCDFRRLGQWRHRGLSVSVYILRSEDASPSYQKTEYYREFLQNLMGLEDMDLANLKTKKKHAAYALLRRYFTDRRREKYRRKLFTRSLEEEAKVPPKKLYYYENEKGKRPRKRRVPDQFLAKTYPLEMEGRTYQIPEAVAVPRFWDEPDLTNVPPRTSYLIYQSDDLTWDDIDCLIDDDAYDALDWDAYGRIKKELELRDDEALAAWHAVMAVEDELQINEQYADRVKEWQGMLKEDRLRELSEAIAPIDLTVHQYAKEKILIHLDEPLKSIYEEYLVRANMDRFLETIRGLEEREKQRN